MLSLVSHVGQYPKAGAFNCNAFTVRRKKSHWLSIEQKINILFIDNRNGHTITEEIVKRLQDTNTAVSYLPPSYTDLIEPCGTFIIKSLKLIGASTGKFPKSQKV